MKISQFIGVVYRRKRAELYHVLSAVSKTTRTRSTMSNISPVTLFIYVTQESHTQEPLGHNSFGYNT